MFVIFEVKWFNIRLNNYIYIINFEFSQMQQTWMCCILSPTFSLFLPDSKMNICSALREAFRSINKQYFLNRHFGGRELGEGHTGSAEAFFPVEITCKIFNIWLHLRISLAWASTVPINPGPFPASMFPDDSSFLCVLAGGSVWSYPSVCVCFCAFVSRLVADMSLSLWTWVMCQL